MKLVKPRISSNQCWKIGRCIYINAKLRWHVGRQYHSDFGAYNHPFWVHLQRRGFWEWKDLYEVSEAFYPRENESIDQFFIRVQKTLDKNPPTE